MGHVDWWKVAVGCLAIVGVFGLFALLLYQSKRTHTRRFGGISYWEILRGRFPKVRKRRRK